MDKANEGSPCGDLLGLFGQTVLVVAAHPDDEALGCGGTIARLVEDGVDVRVAFLADGVGSRDGDAVPDTAELTRRRAAARAAAKALGCHEPEFDDLPDNRLDQVAMLEIARRVEALVARLEPTSVLTHHSGDLNVDHRRLHDAVLTACRPQPGSRVRNILFFEVGSSTEWQTPASGRAPFVPDLFVNITGQLDRKIEALRAYHEEMRPWPHSRSIEAIEHRNRWLGASVGVEAAEGFMLGRALL